MKRVGVDHLYIHYFDVIWSDRYWMPVPEAELSGIKNSVSLADKHYTPVIFIANRCLEMMPNNWCDSLAYKIRNKILSITGKIENNYKQKMQWTGIDIDTSQRQKAFDEIQIDCDWTSTTREKYFNFLKTFKGLFPKKVISATIRLYPYKYPTDMGIPPVAKGLLMCYNLTDIKSNNTTNSIFDLAALKLYLDARPYPLPLDIALPIFSWYAWFSEGNFKGIIYPKYAPSLKINNQNKMKTTYLKVPADTMIGNDLVKEGDVLRYETPNPADLEEAAKLLSHKFPNTSRISFYYFDNNLINRYEKTIQNIYALY